MKQSVNKIVMFPKWKDKLEKTSFKLLKDKKYLEALDIFNQLLQHGETSHEIIFGKLLCLAELKKLPDAIHILERLIFTENNQRHEYVHMYVTMLYQMNEYDQLIDVIDQISEIEKYPQQYREHIEQLYKLSMSFQQAANEQLAREKMKRLFIIIKDDQYAEQRHIIHTLKTFNTYPTDEFFELLSIKEVHPVIKTDLLMWFLSMDIAQPIEIAKLGLHLSINIGELKPIEQQHKYNEVLSQLGEIESDDPVFFSLLVEMFERFLYVWYPLPLGNYHAADIVTALKALGQDTQTDDDKIDRSTVSELIEVISLCDALYLSVVEG